MSTSVTGPNERSRSASQPFPQPISRIRGHSRLSEEMRPKTSSPRRRVSSPTVCRCCVSQAYTRIQPMRSRTHGFLDFCRFFKFSEIQGIVDWWHLGLNRKRPPKLTYCTASEALIGEILYSLSVTGRAKFRKLRCGGG